MHTHAARPVVIRRVDAADAAAMARFVGALEPQARRWRFHGAVKASERVAALLTQADGVRHAAWVATVTTDDGVEQIVGEARYVRDADDPASAELAIAVAAGWRGCNVAGSLLQALTHAAQAAGVQRLVADVLSDNARMLAFMQRHGYGAGYDAERCGDAGSLRLERSLPPCGTGAARGGVARGRDGSALGVAARLRAAAQLTWQRGVMLMAR